MVSALPVGPFGQCSALVVLWWTTRTIWALNCVTEELNSYITSDSSDLICVAYLQLSLYVFLYRSHVNKKSEWLANDLVVQQTTLNLCLFIYKFIYIIWLLSRLEKMAYCKVVLVMFWFIRSVTVYYAEWPHSLSSLCLVNGCHGSPPWCGICLMNELFTSM